MEIRIDQEFESLIRPLTETEHQRLWKKLEREGCLWGLSVWTPENGDGVPILLDGHHRYQWCVENHIVPNLIEIPGIQSRDDAIDWIIEHQLAQRALAPYEAIELARSGEERMRARAASRMNYGMSDPGQIFGQGGESGRVDEIIANKVGTSDETVRKSRVISIYGTDEEKIALRRGEVKIHPIYKLCLERRLRDVWERVAHGESQDSIGQAISLSQPSVSQILKKAREKYGPEIKPQTQEFQSNGVVTLELCSEEPYTDDDSFPSRDESAEWDNWIDSFNDRMDKLLILFEGIHSGGGFQQVMRLWPYTSKRVLWLKLKEFNDNLGLIVSKLEDECCQGDIINVN